MEGVFSLPYSEYEVISDIQKSLKKQDGYAVLIPLSRQQKGMDFAIINQRNNKLIKAQVKSSRAYFGKPGEKYKYRLWFGNFIEKHKRGIADVYFLFGLYPVYSNKKNINSDFWEHVILMLTGKEMFRLLKKIKTKNEKKRDKFFGFGFDDANRIYGTRGFLSRYDLTRFKLAKRVGKLRKMLQ